MGFGVAGVLGARLAAPSRAVAAVVGDGGFLMLPSAVATAVQYGLPAIWLVWNNGGFMKAVPDSGHPTVIDVPVDAEVPQPAVATWDLPPLSYPEPGFGWPDP